MRFWILFLPILISTWLLLAKNVYCVPQFFRNENAVVGDKEKITIFFEYQGIEKYLLNLSRYNIYTISLKGVYTPNNSVEVGFSIPYLKMLEANDNGILGDIQLFSKFVIIKEIFSFIDTFLIQDSLVINVSLATGVKKEDSYRNIGFYKGLYFPNSSGYSDIEIGNSTSLVGSFFSLSIFGSFVSVSSKIEPPLAFNTENDHFVLGHTTELFVYYSKELTIKPFFEITYYLPVSDKSKYINLFLVGGGIWVKVLKTFIGSVGYYQNILEPSDIEKTFSKVLYISLGVRL